MTDFVVVSTLLRWFESWQSLVIMMVSMTVVYIGIWLGEMLYWRKTVRELNEQLGNMHK